MSELSADELDRLRTRIAEEVMLDAKAEIDRLRARGAELEAALRDMLEWASRARAEHPEVPTSRALIRGYAVLNAPATDKEVMPHSGSPSGSTSEAVKSGHNAQPQPAQSRAGAVMCPAGGYTGQPITEPATVENCVKAGVCGCDEMAICAGATME